MGNFNQLILLGRFKKIFSFAKNETVLLIDFNVSDNNHHCIPIYVTGCIIDKINEYCKPNDVICIKGSISTDKDNNIIVIGEKIRFLSSDKQLKKARINCGLFSLFLKSFLCHQSYQK